MNENDWRRRHYSKSLQFFRINHSTALHLLSNPTQIDQHFRRWLNRTNL